LSRSVASGSTASAFAVDLGPAWVWPGHQPRIAAPPDHPRYGHPWLQLDQWQDKLYFCGTETAGAEGGYLEGALEASDRVFTALTL
jgi:monoamine oxidase